jgi:hypothetical protein
MFDGMFLGCHHADIAESRLPGLDAALSDAPIGCGSIDCLGLVLWQCFQCFHRLIFLPHIEARLFSHSRYTRADWPGNLRSLTD